jgi:tRNA(fMet)-specific endonuclease VapC
MYMLDTNILIRIIRHPADPVCQRVSQKIGGELCISSITYAELVYGAKHSSNYEKNIQAVQQLLSGIYILPFDSSAAWEAGDIMAYLAGIGKPIGDQDALIAAHARSLSVTLVTHNTGEFSRVPKLEVEDWL